MLITKTKREQSLFFLIQLLANSNLKLYIMRTNTLKEMLALVEARIKMYEKAPANDPFYKGALVALRSLSEEIYENIYVVKGGE